MEGKEVTSITVGFSDGTTEELTRGCVVNLDKRGDTEMSVDMLQASAIDIVQMAYGLIVTVERIGLKKELLAFLNGSAFKSEEE